MKDIFDADGRIIAETPEPIKFPQKKNQARTAEATETENNSVAMLNAKLDALLQVQGINPLSIKVKAE